MEPIILRLPASASRLRRWMSAAFLVATAGIAASCSPYSTHALATPADTTFDDRFRGRWRAVADFGDSLSFARAEVATGLGSVFTFQDTTGRADLGLRFVQLGGSWFVDAQIRPWQPGTVSPDNEANLSRHKRDHFIMRLEFHSDTLVAQPFCSGCLEDFHKAHPGQLGLKLKSGHYFSDYVLTDDTPKLRSFVAKVAGVDSMFGDYGFQFVRDH